MKTKIFSYYLQKLAEEERKLLGGNERSALLALVLTKAHLFRRFHTGCTTQELCFCNPRYVQELFIYLCLKAKESGSKLLSLFDFKQTTAYHTGMRGRLYLEDRTINNFLIRVFPSVKREEQIEKSLYVALLPELSALSGAEWEIKFSHISNFRAVNLEALSPVDPCEGTALVDAVMDEMKDDEILRKMLSLGSRCDMYGASPVYHAYFSEIRNFPKAY